MKSNSFVKEFVFENACDQILFLLTFWVKLYLMASKEPGLMSGTSYKDVKLYSTLQSPCWDGGLIKVWWRSPKAPAEVKLEAAASLGEDATTASMEEAML